MDILNHMDEEEYSRLSDFLAFVGMYEDRKRIEVYRDLMEENENRIKGGVVVEAGAGFGIFSKYALELGAEKVYMVERNPYMIQILKRRFEGENRVEIVDVDVMDFVPDEDVDVLVHDFYGPLLYDESLYALEHLKFEPGLILPDSGRLVMDVVPYGEILDEVVGEDVVEQLEGVLVSDLFYYNSSKEFKHTVMEWNWRRGLRGGEHCFDNSLSGFMIVFALELIHNGNFLCRAGECENWPLVFTPAAGKCFHMDFEWDGDFTRVYFRWIR